MRKLNLFMIIVWSVLALVIAAFLIAGIAYTGSGGVIGKDISKKLFASNERELLLQKSFPSDDIETIDISLRSESVDIFESPDNDFHVKHYGRNLKENRLISVETNERRLKIRPLANSRIINFGIMEGSWVEIYVPSSYKGSFDYDVTSGAFNVNCNLALSDFNLQLASGNVKCDYTISCTTADFKVTSGNVHLQKLDVPTFNIKLASGTLDINSLSGSGDIKVTSGSAKLGDMDITDSLNVKVQSGNININLSGDPSLKYQGNVTSGDIKTYFDVTYKDKRQNKSAATIGEGPYKKLILQVTSGNIKIGHNGKSEKAAASADILWDFDAFEDD